VPGIPQNFFFCLNAYPTINYGTESKKAITLNLQLFHSLYSVGQYKKLLCKGPVAIENVGEKHDTVRNACKFQLRVSNCYFLTVFSYADHKEFGYTNF